MEKYYFKKNIDLTSFARMIKEGAFSSREEKSHLASIFLRNLDIGIFQEIEKELAGLNDMAYLVPTAPDTFSLTNKLLVRLHYRRSNFLPEHKTLEILNLLKIANSTGRKNQLKSIKILNNLPYKISLSAGINSHREILRELTLLNAQVHFFQLGPIERKGIPPTSLRFRHQSCSSGIRALLVR